MHELKGSHNGFLGTSHASLMAQYSIMIFFLILCEKLSAMATFSKSQIAFKNTVYIPIVFLQVLNVFPEVPFFPCFLLSFHNFC